ncbi:MAG: UbiD family decarboxylase [Candidatus Bathyarchaeia archaeon]|jgi:UbiD family decarboxylase|nr:UbiD family decarboxylase [Candidatus Bathyarchaeota archaeon A05DMB-4]MDH7595233.1 UbiD family decarboxylase [Candidatus Bathyarchaeota archaeon]
MSLRSFLEEKETLNQTLHVTAPVSPRFEISAIMKHFDQNGPVLFFEKIKGYKNRVVANVCGTRERLSTALGVKPESLYQRLIEAWKNPSKPNIAKNGAVKENIVEKPKLSKLPILTHFEKDAAPYVTSAIIHAKSPNKGVDNVSVHRLEVLDDKHFAIRLVPRHLFKLWTMTKEEGKDLDVAISIGLHPAVLVAATSPVPFGVCEFDVANALLKNKFSLVKCAHVDAVAPAEAEIVFEGHLCVNKEVVEGPLVDITGTYDVKRNQPVIEVVGMMHRDDYIYQALLPSGNEHKLLMGLPHEIKIWEAVANVVPKVGAVNLTSGGCGWLHAVVSIEKQKDGDAKNALTAIFGAHPSLKHAIVVDMDIDVYNMEEVEWAIATRFQANEDLILIQNARGSTLDPSADQETGLTTKLGIDATKPISKPKEKFARARIPFSRNAEKVIKNLHAVWK